jgi:hypothetical protein
MRKLVLMLLLIVPLSAVAEPGPLFMKDLLGGREFYEPWGVGIDYYSMDQPYQISSLEFLLPGVILDDPSQLEVQNEIEHVDIKFDVWLTPFLNVFAILGKMDAETVVDLGSTNIMGLDIPLGKLPVDYDGTVYGAGLTLAYGGERWFTSVTATWTDTSLSGDFDSSVSSFTAQPRIGLNEGKMSFWVGGMYLDTDEKHQGVIALTGLGVVPFTVELEGANKWNTVVGAGFTFSPKATVYLEAGFGKRDHLLFNFTYRF